MSMRRLTRLPVEGKVAGVCAGIADYFGVDVVLVRAAWVVLSIVPGAVVGGVVAYLAAWLVMPEGTPEQQAVPQKRLTRAITDKKIAGVCGGLAEYFGVDATPVRLSWVILSLLCGAGVVGLIAYIVAWIIIPRGQEPALTTIVPAAPV
jgi:phage shock protein PspC (stress-responsive transcriptional regulator)